MLWVEGEISSSFLPVKICDHRRGRSSTIVRWGGWRSPAPAAFTHIDGDEVNFCVTMLARLGGGHVNNLAGPALDHDMSVDVKIICQKSRGKNPAGECSPVLPESRALRRIGERGSRAGLLEGVLVLLIVLVVGHAEWRVFSTTTAGLLSVEGSSLRLDVAVDKDRKKSDDLTEVGGDGRNQVANPDKQPPSSRLGQWVFSIFIHHVDRLQRIRAAALYIIVPAYQTMFSSGFISSKIKPTTRRRPHEPRSFGPGNQLKRDREKTKFSHLGAKIQFVCLPSSGLVSLPSLFATFDLQNSFLVLHASPSSRSFP